jgi:hypothetical protein
MYERAMMNVKIFTHFHYLIKNFAAAGDRNVMKMLLLIITEVLANPIAYSNGIELNIYLSL